MKRFILAVLILGIICTMMACKKNTADPGENTGNTAAETPAVETQATESSAAETSAGATSETAEAAVFEPMETVENLQIELQEGQMGAVSPD